MKWLFGCFLIIGVSLAQNVGVGTATPDGTAKLDVSSTTSGFLPPRMTTVQRDAISSPAEGLMIYNTDTKCMEFWNATQWISTCADVAPCSPPPASTPGANTPVCENETLNLTATPVVGATYVWSGPNSYNSTAQNPSISPVALTDSGTYYLRTWLLGCYSDEQSIQVEVVPTPWEQLSNIPIGSSRVGAAAFTVGANGYVMGGRNGCNDFNNTYQYVPGTDTWTEVAAMPVQRSYLGSFAIADSGYVVGGHRDDVCAANSANAYRYDANANSWSAITSFAEGRSYSFYNCGDGSLGFYGMGGFIGGCFRNTFYSYDPATNSWTARASYPPGTRALQSTFTIAGKIYMIGGTQWSGWNGGCPNTTHTETYEYDPAANIWTARAVFPGTQNLASSQIASFALGGYGYVIDQTKTIYQYDPTANTWTALTCPFPGASGSRRYATFVVGGSAYFASTWDGDTWKFTP